MGLWNSQHELFEIARRELFTAVVGDVMADATLRLAPIAALAGVAQQHLQALQVVELTMVWPREVQAVQGAAAQLFMGVEVRVKERDAAGGVHRVVQDILD